MSGTRGQMSVDGITASSLLRSVVAGAVCGVLAVVLSISKGALLVADGLPDYAPYAIGMALFTTVAVALIRGLTGQSPGTVAIVQDVPTVALATVIGAVAANLADRSDPDTVVATLVVVVGGATVIFAGVSLLLAYFHLGGIVRYVPFPVIGGFLAGTGWLIALGGFGLVIGETVTLDMVFNAVAMLSYPAVAANAAFAIVTVAILVLVDRLASGGVALPIAILAILGVFNLVASALGVGPQELREIGWLVKLPSSDSLWPSLPVTVLGRVDWTAVAAGALVLPEMMVLIVLAMLLNASGADLATRRNTDLDRELRSVGLMNIVAGAGGGPPGFVSVSMTVLAHRLGAATRLVGPIVALLSLSALVAGPFVLASVPTFLLGAILIWIGGGLLGEWLVRSTSRLSRFEYVVILVIFAVTVGVGFEAGILVGIVAAALVFIVIYGRVNTIRFALTGADYVRSSEMALGVGAEGGRNEHVLVFALQGFLFFGTADKVRADIEKGITAEARVDVLLVDFRRVSGLDSSAVLSFQRIHQTAAESGIQVVFSGMSGEVADALRRGGLSEDSDGLHIEPDLDRAGQWIEGLRSERGDDQCNEVPIEELLAARVGKASGAVIQTYLERLTVAGGETLVAEGAKSDDIYFLESGRAAVELPSESGATLRLAGLAPGTMVGEIAFLLGLPRSATIVIEREAVVWKLSREALTLMEAEAPNAATRLQAALARTLARRVVNANRLLRLLAD